MLFPRNDYIWKDSETKGQALQGVKGQIGVRGPIEQPGGDDTGLTRCIPSIIVVVGRNLKADSLRCEH